MFTVPAGAPENIKTVLYENNTAKITWDPPHESLHNKLVEGYKVIDWRYIS